MGHGFTTLKRIEEILRVEYSPEEYDFAYELGLQRFWPDGPPRVQPDIIVLKKGEEDNPVVCIVEIGYTDAQKVMKYRKYNVPDFRWYAKDGTLVLHEYGNDITDSSFPTIASMTNPINVLELFKHLLMNEEGVEARLINKRKEVVWRHTNDITGDRSIHNLVLSTYCERPLVYRYLLNSCDFVEDEYVAAWLEEAGRNIERYIGLEYSVLPEELLPTIFWMRDAHEFLRYAWGAYKPDDAQFSEIVSKQDMPPVVVPSDNTRSRHFFGYIWSSAASIRYKAFKEK